MVLGMLRRGALRRAVPCNAPLLRIGGSCVLGQLLNEEGLFEMASLERREARALLALEMVWFM